MLPIGANVEEQNEKKDLWTFVIFVAALLHMAGLENSECIWKIQRKPEVAVSVSLTEISNVQLQITDILFF
jgi:hypothetical protein